MTTKNNLFHGCYSVVILCICGNIRNMKCTVIGQDVTLHVIHSYKNKCTV